MRTYHFKIYDENGDKHFTDDMSYEKAHALHKRLVANGEVFMALVTNEDGEIEETRIFD